MNEWTALQNAGCERLWQTIDKGSRSNVICAPTGFGKTRIVKNMIQEALRRKMTWQFYTHRKALFLQTHNSFSEDLIHHGCRASGWGDFWSPHSTGQLSMIQTESAKVDDWVQPKPDIVFIDEVHANQGGYAAQMVQRHLSEGAIVNGVTATPVGLGDYKHLEVFATTSQARRVGAILRADVYAPDEVDISDVKIVNPDGEFSQRKLAKRFMRQQVVGSVYKHWLHLNSHGLPAVGFGPDVAGSVWFCDEFSKKGVKCAHIDGEKVYLGEKDREGNAVIYKGKEGEQARADVEKMSQSGEVQIVWNRFVMREGIDWPWLYHAIFATSFASTEAWIQSCGRVMRSFAGMDHCLITDHGGNVWRPGLGSPNADRDWKLGDTNSSIRKESKQKMEQGEEKQPKGCPKCGSVVGFDWWVKHGESCHKCGFKFSLSSRMVLETDGKLRKVKGDAVKKKSEKSSDAQKAWDSFYYKSKNSKSNSARTFNQLRNEFQRTGKYSITYHKVNGELKTVAVHRQSGAVTVLRSVPPPRSINWDRQAKAVEGGELQ